MTFVSAEPEYNEYVLGPNDQFFLIASDGIWDVMHNQVRVEGFLTFFDKLANIDFIHSKQLT